MQKQKQQNLQAQTAPPQAATVNSQIEACYTVLQLPAATLSNLSGAPSQSQGHLASTFRLENNTAQFSIPKAIAWQMQFIISGIVSKKTIATATLELQSIQEKFGSDFDKYLIRELIDQIDLKDPNKPSKDRSEPIKCLLLNQELARACLNSDFLHYFEEIASTTYGEGKYKDFLREFASRLKLNSKMQLLVALSLFESQYATQEGRKECVALLKQKIIEYHQSGTTKADLLEEYALHRLNYILNTVPEFFNSQDPAQLDEAKRFLLEHNVSKAGANVALRLLLGEGDLIGQNPVPEDPVNSLIRVGSGIDHLQNVNKILEPWQVLIDLGHFSSLNYNMLSLALQDFKDISEKTMASTLLHLAVHHSGNVDLQSQIIFNIYEANKLGDPTNLKKEPSEKSTVVQWHVGNFSRAFRENYSNLNWLKVFESFSELPEDVLRPEEKLNQKAYSILLQIFNKSKPQNLQVPISLLLDQRWKSPSLQIQFISNAIASYVSGEDKTFAFAKLGRRIGLLPEISGSTEVAATLIDVWSAPEVIEILINLSETCHFRKVRIILDLPLQQCPEYFLLALSQIKVERGTLLIDELLTILMTTFLGNHPNSIPVLRKLWEMNQELMIRSICELCRHDQKIMNLSRVLDITQEIKESLIKIVYCNDFDFSVSLGVLAGKRDFLHYDVWLKERIKQVGTPFVQAMIKYVNENVIVPTREMMAKHGFTLLRLANMTQQQLSSDEIERLEPFKETILERAHMSKERFCITMEALENPSNFHSPSGETPQISEITQIMIRELIQQYSVLYPKQVAAPQNSEEIDRAANDYFQQIFSAEPSEVNQRIAELIETMKAFKQSNVVKEQEIYACMLHSLFDEYRFLHKYPQQFLEKIAKLFGAIIKNRLLDPILQDISLKFVIEAFRRDGKRLTFGIIVVKEFFDSLPEFPRQFQEIYTNRDKIQQRDPHLYQQFMDLYRRTFESEDRTRDDNAIPESDDGVHPPINLIGHNFGNENMGSLSDGDTSMFSITEKELEETKHLEKPVVNKKDRDKSQKANVKSAAEQSLFAPIQKGPNKNIGSNEKRKNSPLISGKPNNFMDEEQKRQQFAPNDGQTSISGLNIASAAFNRSTDKSPFQPQPVVEPKPVININAKMFRPTETAAPEVVVFSVEQQPNAEHLAWQEVIDKKISEAKIQKTKIRLEDLIEDHLLQLPNQESQEHIKFICNNTGKSNFKQKMEELKSLIQGPSAELNLNWFLHYILTKRISTQFITLHHIYIELIRQLGVKVAVAKTIKLAMDIFKRCMLIQEDELNKVINRAAGGSQISTIKQYLMTLGQFIGSITLANNRPIFSKEIDLKHLLLQAYQDRRMRFVVVFVCRILKESSKSTVFRVCNPWIQGLLQVLREIYDQCQTPQLAKQSEEMRMEIEVLFKALNDTNLHEIQPSGILKSFQYQTDKQKLIEITFYDRKEAIMPQRANLEEEAPQPMVPQNIEGDMTNSGLGMDQEVNDDFEIELKRFNNMGQILPNVVVQEESLLILQRTFKISEGDLRKIIAESVESSINDILPPVVTRSVTIALITTRELVLKDFAYDGDIQKLTDAVDNIVQNLAGSLALVTCREPLRISLTEYLNKQIKNGCFIAGTTQGLAKGNDLRARDHSEAAEAQAKMHDLQLNNLIIDNENMISEIAQNFSKENLELGCKVIKNTVFDSAIRRIRQDPTIIDAIEKRRLAAQRRQQFADETHLQSFQDLPERLRPNPTGLTNEQIKVYNDFSKLNGRSKMDSSLTLQTMRKSEPAVYGFTLDGILNDIEKAGCLTPVTRSLMTLKLQEICRAVPPTSSTDTTLLRKFNETKNKLWVFCEKQLLTICLLQQELDSNQDLQAKLEILSLIVKKFTAEDLGKRLLTESFLVMEEFFFLNVDLNILLMKNQIIPIQDWDKEFSILIRDAPGQLQERALQFLIEFMDKSIIKQKLIPQEKLPSLVKVVKKTESTMGNDAHSIALKAALNTVIFQLNKQLKTPLETQLKAHFTKWVELSYITDTQAQEKEMGSFNTELSNLGFDKDQDKLFAFCNVMVKCSIDLTLQSQSGRPQNNNALLDYRFIDSFVKLSMVLIKAFEFNKQEFMSKIFEFIKAKLDEDHNTQLKMFNQKPYYRMLINILTVVNMSDCFNQKTQRQIFFDMADLLKELNPNAYPAFAFAWLELISHRLFMPNFIKKIAQPQETSSRLNAPSDQSQNQAWFSIKDLIVQCFQFLKQNMVIGQKTSPAMQSFYTATIRIILVILKDYPEFLCDFHFNFVNSLPDHAIQLKNMILAAVPKNISPPDPFSKDLKVDTMNDVKDPRILSNFEVYLGVNNLKDQLDNYFKTKNPELINDICAKMQGAKEKINGRIIPYSAVINAVVLYIAQQTLRNRRQTQESAQNENQDLFKLIMNKLNDETRLCFLNSIVNELRYPNSHTFFFCLILITLFMDSKQPVIQEQISTILFERLQSYRPYPWGLMINFRELIQNTTYGFMKSPFIQQNKQAIAFLFDHRLRPFIQFIQHQPQPQVRMPAK